MKIKKIKCIIYKRGDEKRVQQFIYQSKEPVLIKIKDFTDEFSLDYFQQYTDTYTTYNTFENNYCIAHQGGDFVATLAQIKENQPHRIFAQLFAREESAKIEQHIPLWQTLPFRPRYFNHFLKVAYFFGGRGSNTAMHFDREHCCNLHICFCGKKQLILFTEDQNKYLYKTPFLGDSLIDFGQPLEAQFEQFPLLKQAEGYKVTLEKGDMLFMPRNCWHYTQYLDASAAATYAFYPKKFFQFYGHFTGYFFFGYQEATGFKLNTWPVFSRFIQRYAMATGKTKWLYQFIETCAYLVLLPLVSVLTMLSFKFRPRRVF